MPSRRCRVVRILLLSNCFAGRSRKERTPTLLLPGREHPRPGSCARHRSSRGRTPRSPSEFFEASQVTTLPSSARCSPGQVVTICTRP
ncbi:unnamed protein product [Lampetra planeri]